MFSRFLVNGQQHWIDGVSAVSLAPNSVHCGFSYERLPVHLKEAPGASLWHVRLPAPLFLHLGVVIK